MSVDFSKLEPSALWQRFGELKDVARPSKAESAAMDWVRQWADQHQFEHRSDSAGNVCVHVPATDGFESAEPIIIQGHVDIVVADEASAPVEVDSARGIIPVVRANLSETGQPVEDADGGWVWAPYTTLGADNGIGCAAGMAVAEMPDVSHPPLQLLFTVDEEQGMSGALNFDPASLGLTAQRLINLDTEEDEDLTIGCAGGADTTLIWSGELTSLNADDKVLQVGVKDLRGGHSGIEINAGRCNANRALARALLAVAEACPLRLIAIDGGEKRNAIPRFASATVAIPKEELPKLQEKLATLSVELTSQFEGRDGPVEFTQEEGSGDAGFTQEDSRTLLQLLTALPEGVFAMTAEIPDLPETSNNLATISTTQNEVHIGCNSRSSQAPGLEDVLDSISALANLVGASATQSNRYPGWKPNVKSPLLETTARVYRELFQEEPNIQAVHAGLECGVLGDKLPGLDSISFGPNIRGNHAPGEHVEIASVNKSFRLLVALLEQLGKA